MNYDLAGTGLKNVIAVATLLLLPLLSFATTTDVKFNYGEPGPRAGTGFADLNPTNRSDANADVRTAMNDIQQWIIANLDTSSGQKARLIVDVAADHFDGPVVEKDGELQTAYRVRLKVQRHRAVFEHRIYEVSGSGDIFREGLINAVQEFIARPNVAQLIGYDQNQAVALK